MSSDATPAHRTAGSAPGGEVQEVLLAMGSNLGDREAHLRRGIRHLEGFVHVTRVSPMYETDPVGGPAQAPFLNLALRGRTSLDPHALLASVQEVERLEDRVREVRNGPRTLDVDILYYGSLVVRAPELQVPHPRLVERAFVLVPLAEIAEGWVDPLSGRTVGELRARFGANPHGVRRHGRLRGVETGG